jgi:hypothetical protein
MPRISSPSPLLPRISAQHTRNIVQERVSRNVHGARAWDDGGTGVDGPSSEPTVDVIAIMSSRRGSRSSASRERGSRAMPSLRRYRVRGITRDGIDGQVRTGLPAVDENQAPRLPRPAWVIKYAIYQSVVNSRLSPFHNLSHKI